MYQWRYKDRFYIQEKCFSNLEVITEENQIQLIFLCSEMINYIKGKNN